MTLPDLTFREGGSFVYHDELEPYPAVIGDIKAEDGKYGPSLKFVLYLDGEINDDGTQRDTWAYTTQVFSRNSRLYRWASNIMGKDNIPEVFNPGTLIGQRVDVYFERYQGTDPDGNPVEKEKVVNLRKSKTPTQSATTVATPTVTTVTAGYEPDEMPF